MSYPDFYTAERTRFVSNNTDSDLYQDYFDFENVILVKSLRSIVFPNPFENFVHIRTEGINTKLAGAIVQDLFGRTIASYTHLNELDEVKIELDKMVSGTYILKVFLSDNSIETHKLIKP